MAHSVIGHNRVQPVYQFFRQLIFFSRSRGKGIKFNAENKQGTVIEIISLNSIIRSEIQHLCQDFLMVIRKKFLL